MLEDVSFRQIERIPEGTWASVESHQPDVECELLGTTSSKIPTLDLWGAQPHRKYRAVFF